MVDGMKVPTPQLKELRTKLETLAHPERAKASARYFKTGPGGYAEGDQFLGITVPEVRRVARLYAHISQEETLLLLRSPLHEERLLALFLLIQRFNASTNKEQHAIYKEYLAHTVHINNWDLVDTSAAQIIGRYLATQSAETIKSTLRRLANSSLLWERRIAMVATFHWIKAGEASQALDIATILLHDKEDLIQKAVGWMLREVGKRCSREILCAFLDAHVSKMGRTALRYSIEHFPEPLRQAYLNA